MGLAEWIIDGTYVLLRIASYEYLNVALMFGNISRFYFLHIIIKKNTSVSHSSIVVIKYSKRFFEIRILISKIT